MIPFIRSREIEIDATNLKPNTKHFIYFDGIRVDGVRPYSADISRKIQEQLNHQILKQMVMVNFVHFNIPNDNFQRFPTGQREVRINIKCKQFK